MEKKTEPVYKGRYTASEMVDIDLDTLNRMSRSELAKVVSRMTDVSKKRLKTLEKNNELTPAYYGLKEKSVNGDLSVRGKDINELRAMYKQQKSFITAKTSTMKGARAVKENLKNRLHIEFSNKEQEKKFWSAYNKYLERSQGQFIEYNKMSDVVQEQIADMMVNSELSEDEIFSAIDKFIDDEIEEEYDDIFDDFYDLDDF